jgi:guanylate kinase
MAPPSMQELERRLVNRGTNTKEDIKKRMTRAEEEMIEAKEIFKHTVVNDNAHHAAKEIERIIKEASNV